MTVYIIANGDITNYEWLAQSAFGAASAIIAADGGVHHLYKIKRLPSFVIGDDDSFLAEAHPDVEHWLSANAVRFHRFSAEKDETDLELAIAYALDHCVAQDDDGDIVIYGAFGGRVDQELANFMLLAHPRFKASQIVLADPYQRVWLLRAGQAGRVFGRIGDTLSLIPIGGDTHITATHGLKWELSNSTLAFGPARGVSNVLTTQTATIQIKSGYLLCIHIDQAWQR